MRDVSTKQAALTVIGFTVRLRRCRRKHRTSPTSRARLPLRWLRRTVHLPRPAQPAPQDAAAAAPIPPELTELLQTMARDLANVQQGIEQLKEPPGRTGQRECQDRRATQGEPGANGPCDRQRLRAEPVAQDISGTATADCHPCA